jgi:hypothetical protein
MENMICTSETNLWAAMLISFAIGYIMPAVGRYAKEWYGRTQQE